jgi:hypothetical protein
MFNGNRNKNNNYKYNFSAQTTPHSHENKRISLGLTNFFQSTSPNKSEINVPNFETNRHEKTTLLFNNDGIINKYNVVLLN